MNSQEELESAESVKGPIPEVVVEEVSGKGLRNKRTGRTVGPGFVKEYCQRRSRIRMVIMPKRIIENGILTN